MKTTLNIKPLLVYFFLLCTTNIAYAETTANQAALFKPFMADYFVSKKKTAIAHITFKLSQADNLWRYESKAKAHGLATWFTKDTVSEYTLFTIHNNQIQPTHYHYQRDNKKKGKQVDIVFDWDAKTATITSSVAEENKTLPLKTGMQDQLSLQLALMLNLQTDQQQTDYTVLDGAREKAMTFSNEGQETIKITSGEYATHKLIRKHRSRETIGWYADKLDFLPVKLQRFKEGKLKSQMELNSFKWL